MFTFNARQLLRGLDVASYPARLADEPVGARLTTVPLEVTDQGLIAYSTDRYQIARTLTEYALEAPAHGAGLPPVRLHRSGLKVLLPVLRAAKKDGTVELTADEDTVTFTVHAANGQVQTVPLKNYADADEYPKIASLFRLHTQPRGALEEGTFTVNPKYVKALADVTARYTSDGEVLTFDPDTNHSGKPVAWVHGQWAHGILMPIRRDQLPTIDAEYEGVGRLFRAVPLMQSPESASVQESSAVERASNRRTAEAPATA